MTKKKDNATQKLYKMFINIAKKTPNIFKFFERKYCDGDRP